MDKFPTCVPVTEISDYTDDIVVGNLGVPVGFEENQLAINLRAFERIRRIAGLGTVSIRGVEGERSHESLNITGVDSSGAATASKRVASTKVPKGSGSVRFGGLNSSFGLADATLNINTSEIDEILQNDKDRKAMFDPRKRASAMNEAVKQALRETIWKANADRQKALFSLRYYGGFTALSAGTGGLESVERIMPFVVAAAPLLQTLGLAREASLLPDMSIREVLKEFRHSLVVGCALDRYAAAMGVAASRSLVRVSK